MAADGGAIELTFRAKLDQLDKDMATARTKATQAASDMGDEMATKVGSKFAGLGARISEELTPQRLIAAGASIGVAGAALTKLADEGKQATGQLKQAIENAGGSYDELAPRIGKVSEKLIKLGIDDEATARAMAILTTATQDPAKALDSMGLASDIAAAKHISLESAADMLAKAYNGNAKAFKAFGINLAANATEEERSAAITELSNRVHGQAAVQADTFGNKLDVLRIRAENFGEAMGAKVGPALTVAGPLIGGLGAIIQSGLVPGLISGIASAWSFAAGMVGAGVSAAGAAIPILIAWAPIILTIAAIGVAAYLLYKNWDEVWGFITGITGAAWSWIKEHLDLIAAVVLLPLAPLILLVTHWDEAWGFVKNITGAALSWLWDTVSGGLADLVGLWFSLPGRAADALSSLGGMIVDVAAAAMRWLWDTISNGFGDVVNLAAELPGRIADAVGDLGGLLWDAGVAVVRGLVNGILSMGSWLWDQVTGFISRNIPGPVKRVLGISSPSKVAMALMMDFGRGLDIGLDRAGDMVSRAAAGSVFPLTDAGNYDVGTSPAPGAMDAGGLASALRTALAGQGMNMTFNTPIDPLHVAREIAWAQGA